MTVLERNEQLETALFNLKGVVRGMRKALTDFSLAYENNYRLYLRHRLKVDKPHGYPKAPWRNAVLKTCQEWEDAVKQVKALGLPLRSDLPKNWDCLAALDCILGKTNSDAYILDAGAELYSVTLPWLYLY